MGGKASFGYIHWFNGSIICTGIRGEGFGLTKKAEARAIPIAFNRAKVWGVRRGQFLCGVRTI